MIVKKHINEGRLLLALCDTEILGKKFEDADLMLDLTSSFYQGEEKTAEEVKEDIKQAYIINAVGDNAVTLLVKEKLISEESISKIKNIPYVQLVFDQKK